MFSNNHKIFLVLLTFLLFFPLTGLSATVTLNFNVEEKFDAQERMQVEALLVKTTPELYFYVEKPWWNLQTQQKQSEILFIMDNLSEEFSGKIHPSLTEVYGSEWNPGVDGDPKINILFHPMKSGVSGYFRGADGYLKLQFPRSNEREIIYLSTDVIDSPHLKEFLAHEFVHLITFNQKDRLRGVSEEIWLNEARAEYALTLLDYNDTYSGSNLEKRVNDFLVFPSSSVTEWRDSKYDYSAINLFIHYLADHYSVQVLIDSLKSNLTGIPSISDSLVKLGVSDSFAEIFTNWAIATAINDCSVDLKYCYLNQNLKNIKINPTVNFLPFSGASSLSTIKVTKNWAGNWHKIVGGSGDLTLKFSSLPGLNFEVPYIIFDKSNNYSVEFLKINPTTMKGEIKIADFDQHYNSLLVMPLLQTKILGFDGAEFTYPYTLEVSTTGRTQQIGGENQSNQLIIQQLREQIAALQKQITALLARRGAVAGVQDGVSCSSIDANLEFGMNSDKVKCLQEFLKQQGPEIYPEGLTTGYFGSLTKAAVIRFQEKYAAEILVPWGLSGGTGYVGTTTREKINSLLNI